MAPTTATPMFSDPVALALVGVLGTFLSGLLGLLATVLSRQSTAQKSIIATQQSVEATQQSVDAQHSTIKALEVNTNSKMDRMLSVKGDEQFAKGLKIGIDSANGNPAGVAALAADIQSKADHAQGVVEGTAAEKARAATEKAAQSEPKKEA